MPESTPKRLLCGLVLCLLLVVPAFAQEDAPAEPKPDPGVLVPAFERRGGDFVLRQYELRGLGPLSYLVGSGGEAFVVDPQRDVEPYVHDADALGLRITKVVLTHTHTDFVAGHAELRARTGAVVVTARDLDPGWQADALGVLGVAMRPLEGGDRDGLLIRIDTPPQATEGAATFVLTGDTLLVGTVGCPEDVSFGVATFHRAEQVIDAVQTLKQVPDEARILPGHGGGRFGGRMLEPYTVTSLARERVANPFLAIESRAALLGRVLALQVAAPASAAHIAALNRRGPPRVAWDALPVRVAPHEVPPVSDAWVLDVRDQAAYSAGHVLGAVNIPVRGAFEPWVATVVPHDARLVLVGTEQEMHMAVRRLHRVGYVAASSLDGGMAGWTDAGRPVERCALVGSKDLARRRAAGIEPVLVDVRSRAEHRACRLADCVNVPLEEFARLGRLLQPETRCILICKTGYRSGIGVGLAERMGILGADNLAGGVRAWRQAGLPFSPTQPCDAR